MIRVKHVVLFFWMILCAAALAGEAKSPWDMELLSKPPKTYPAPEFKAEGVKALFYECLALADKPTRSFAWVGVPAVKPGQKVPGVVLVHGGSGTAEKDWVELWVKRGYAAIAMDCSGCVPRQEGKVWARHESGGPPGWGTESFKQLDRADNENWIYHAVADVILAHSLLRSLPDVDAERIGITGISWGGILTCIVAGVDERFKFAVPVYGCGFLYEDSAWAERLQKMEKAKSERWICAFDPSHYLGAARGPALWVAGTNDQFFPLDSLQKSYRLPKGPRTLCIRLRMPHGGEEGSKAPEIFAFADSIVKSGAPLATVSDQGAEGSEAWVRFSCVVPVEKAELNFTRDRGPWLSRKWETAPARLDLENHKAAAALSKGTTVYYFNLIDTSGLIVSSEHVELSSGK